MNQSIIEALVVVNDAVGVATELDQWAEAAVKATEKALGCQSAALWLLAARESDWLASWRQLPGIGGVLSRLQQNGSHSNGSHSNGSHSEEVQLHLASTVHSQRRAWQSSPLDKPFDRLRTSLKTGPFDELFRGLPIGTDQAEHSAERDGEPQGEASDPELEEESTTLAALTGGQVATTDELAALSSQALRVGDADANESSRVVAGLFHADEPIGVLTCTWAENEGDAPSELRELFVVCLANYFSQLFSAQPFDSPSTGLGARREPSPETGLYVAGAGLLLTALDVGSPAVKECAEALTRSTLAMAGANGLHPPEAQSLQWAALFHEVGRAPMDRWLTFPNPDGGGDDDSVEPERDAEWCLTLIPKMQPAAELLTQVTPVLDGQTDDLDAEDMGLPAQLLAKACLSSHCGQSESSAEPPVASSEDERLQPGPQTGEAGGTVPAHSDASQSASLGSPAPQTV
ncbi:MAG: hypothetical protein MAG451_03176 [Anaerolineales bacterium]|nr:hypothetical protein [Anaerolineales bacterium]